MRYAHHYCRLRQSRLGGWQDSSSAAGHDLTLIDLSERRLDELSNTYDLAAVKGSGTSYHVLREAGVQDTDLLIAVTTHDEINLLSCLIARKASGCHAIARVRDPEYVSDLGFIRDEAGYFRWSSTLSCPPRVLFRV